LRPPSSHTTGRTQRIRRLPLTVQQNVPLGKACEVQGLEPRGTHSLVDGRSVSATPPAFAAGCTDPGAIFGHAQAMQEAGNGFGAFALLEAQASQATPEPLVHRGQVRFTRRVAEERYPAGDKLIGLLDHLLKAYAPAACGDSPKTLPCAIERLVFPIAALG
jgi:hypothetical protein